MFSLSVQNLISEYMKLFYGGVNNGQYPTAINHKIVKQYDLWKGMMRRCYSSKEHQRRPTYIDCTVSDNFKQYSYFYEWCLNQIGFNNKGWPIDKDILLKGNKIYHEDLCVFVPPEINTLLVKHESLRGAFPIGVTFQDNRFIAQCRSKYYGHKYLGSFDTAERAFEAYKAYKEGIIKDVANRFKSIIDSRVYQALLTYSVSFHD